MSEFIYIVAVVLIIALLISFVGFLISHSKSYEEKRRDELRTRHMSRQPWDAESPDGRGNR